MKRMLMLGATIGLLAGCSDALPTEPRVAQDGPAQAAPLVGTASQAVARDAVEDAIERIVPMLDDAEGAARIDTVLRTLHSAMGSVTTLRIPPLVQYSREAIDAYGDAGDAAELDFIRLAIDYVAAVYGIS